MRLHRLRRQPEDVLKDKPAKQVVEGLATGVNRVTRPIERGVGRLLRALGAGLLVLIGCLILGTWVGLRFKESVGFLGGLIWFMGFPLGILAFVSVLFRDNKR